MLIFSGAGRSLEDRALDLAFRLRPQRPPPSDLLIVGIDEPSFKELRRPWPWPRRLHAALVDRLAELGARLIIFDVLFAEETSPEDDALLAAALKRAGNVILGQALEVVQDPRFARRMLIEPWPELRQAAGGVGLMALTPDPDGVVRRFRLHLGGEPTLAAVAAARLGVALPPELAGLIDFIGPPRSINTVSYYQALDLRHPLPEAQVRGRIVLVGRMLEASATPQAQADAFFIPFYAADGRLMSGVEVHANILHTLLTGGWGKEAGPGVRLGWVGLLLTLAVLLRGGRPGLAVALLTLFMLTALALAVSYLLFVWWRFWLPPVLPVAGLVAWQVGLLSWDYLREYREKRWLRQAFGRYVSPAVVAELVAHPERLRLGGEELEATVMFADVAGFTGLSETLTPEELVSLLNRYFSTLTGIIQARGGMVDKFIGDAVMAVWGAPLPLSDHAALACHAALEIQAAMAQALGEGGMRPLPPLTVRLGVHSGPVLAGNVGSVERFNYTVMGDTVNLAARLEGVNRHYGTAILISDATFRQVEGAFMVRKLDRLRVKGRRQPVTVYELLGPAGESTPAWLAAFQAGLEAYRTQEWTAAIHHFEAVLRQKPGDGPARLFLQRCRHYQKEPPPPEWDGVFALEEK